jgi:predicted ATP-grasp superfamily ATP-dependent carboligase
MFTDNSLNARAETIVQAMHQDDRTWFYEHEIAELLDDDELSDADRDLLKVMATGGMLLAERKEDGRFRYQVSPSSVQNKP